MTVLAILGMHRSGTSWLAGTLEAMGLALGDVATQNPFNERGNRENPDILRLHGSVIQASGGGWRNPPRAAIWSDQQRRELATIIASMGARFDVWGFKDPRAMFVLDEWRRQVDGLRCVGIYRDPNAVAASMADRGSHSVPRDEALDLWCTYNERLLAVHRAAPFPLLCFDARPDALLADVVRIAPGLGLDATRADAFFAQEIRHQRAESNRLPLRCRRMMRRLEAARG